MSNEIATVDSQTGDLVPVINHEQALTHEQARVNSVSLAYSSAMNKASTLVLSKEESDGLQTDFPDEAFKKGAAGKDDLIYIEHAYLRDRLNSVLGLGQWAILRTRPNWAENYEVKDWKTKGMKPAIRVYSDCCLIIRGCMVGEAIGDMSYFPDNASMTYSDCAEGSKTQALRRCAKDFGIGLQAWKKGWCDGWWKRNPSGRASYQPKQAEQPSEPLPPAKPRKPFTVESLVKKAHEAEDVEQLDSLTVWLDKRTGVYDTAERKPIRAAISIRQAVLTPKPKVELKEETAYEAPPDQTPTNERDEDLELFGTGDNTDQFLKGDR